MTDAEQDLIDYPLKEGYVRIYMDHTGRYFEDRLPYERGDDPIYDLLSDEIQKEINQEIIKVCVDTALKISDKDVTKAKDIQNAQDHRT